VQETAVIHAMEGICKEKYTVTYEHMKVFSKKKDTRELRYSKSFKEYFFLIIHSDGEREKVISHRIPLSVKLEYTRNVAIVNLHSTPSVSFISKRNKFISEKLEETIDETDGINPSEITTFDEMEYQEVLQAVVNKMQSMSYEVDIKSLALLMTRKTTKLIIMRRR
jgi:hypothetical protein